MGIFFDRVKLIIVHYHFRPGGIRRVIELATPQLVRARPTIASVLLVGGEAPDPAWTKNFARLIAPAQLEISTHPALGYYSEQPRSAKPNHQRVTRRLAEIFPAGPSERIVVWAHNLGIGRNLPLTRALQDFCAARQLPLLSHHHDWWFDNRWVRWPEMHRSGFRTAATVARAVFGPAPGLRHAAINQEEADILQQHSPNHSTWLPNLATPPAAPARARTQAARRWLRQQLEDAPAPVWILPCRLLRRKNVAEALLLTRWLRPEAWLVTTGAASSADEQGYYQRLQAATRRHQWRLRLGVLANATGTPPSVPELLAASEAVLLTSIQEGFGLPYLEAAAAAKPLFARNLPNIAPDLRQFGFRFPYAYDEILVPLDLFDGTAERARQQKLFTAWRRQLPRALRSLTGVPALPQARSQPTCVPFSRLTLTAQLEVLAQPPEHSWARCAPLNSFLSAWRISATAGQLKPTRWPAQAARWLSGVSYARRFYKLLAQPPPAAEKFSAPRLQQDFFRKKLCAANLYPLLWVTES